MVKDGLLWMNSKQQWRDNQQKAMEVIEEIYGKFENVQLFPGMGSDLSKRVHFRTNYKYVVWNDYVIIYKAEKEFVEIYRVLNRYQNINDERKVNGMLFLCYPKCSTCQKAKKWLEEHNIEYAERHIAENNPTYDELEAWYKQSGLPLKKFFNTSGLVYKEMQLKDKLPLMREEEQLKLLATNGMLVKRPIVISEDKVLVGFKAAEWEVLL